MNHNHEYHSNKPEIKANVVYRDGNIEITLEDEFNNAPLLDTCLLYTSPSPRDRG